MQTHQRAFVECLFYVALSKKVKNTLKPDPTFVYEVIMMAHNAFIWWFNKNFVKTKQY